jgi:cobalt-zinc-cadmium efflux system outer membrane protein
MRNRRFQIRLIDAFKNLLGNPYSVCMLLAVCCLVFFSSSSYADEVTLNELISEALKNSPEILASQSRAAASRYRIPQAKSLPDPMVMFGYQNEGFNKYSYGDELMSQWMFSASQMFPFPGKLPLKGEMASREAEGQEKSYESTRLRTVLKVKELYYDLFLAYKDIDLIKDRTALFSRIEDAALARYSSGMGQQQEVLMAQTEKYMLLEKEEMLKQKIQSLEGMLNTTVGRDVNSPLGRPEELSSTSYTGIFEEMVATAGENSPELRAREKMASAAEVKVRMARKEYYPDFTVTAQYDKKGGPFMDMWALTTAINIPLYYKTKQRQAVYEAEASLSEARSEVAATKLMIASSMRDNYSMLRTSEKLMELYKNGLIPKTYQDFEATLAGYMTGKIEAFTVISRLKSLIDYETSYWGQFVEREKTIARLEAITGAKDYGTAVKVQ